MFDEHAFFFDCSKNAISYKVKKRRTDTKTLSDSQCLFTAFYSFRDKAVCVLSRFVTIHTRNSPRTNYMGLYAACHPKRFHRIYL